MKYIRKAEKVDVLLICEGTFPYIKGGVSSWIYQIITSMKELKFGIIFLGGYSREYDEIKYELPDNLLHLEVHYLFESLLEKQNVKKVKEIPELKQKMYELHKYFREHGNTLSDELKKIDFYMKIDENQFLRSKNSFEFITSEYLSNAKDVPFIDYFWTVRSTHVQIWKIVGISKNIPECSLVHSPSSGYAGFLGSFIKNNYGKKFILTEHGIYLLERKIDIMLAEWINEYKISLLKDSSEKNYLKELWINFFSGLNKFTYDIADIIISLYEGARENQIKLGADISKTLVIPNGVDIERFRKLRKRNTDKYPNRIALVGRVVPIKDIKTFITAVKIISSHIPDIEGWIVGPADEDPEYYNECRELVRVFGLEKNIIFKGFTDMENILPNISIICLTSISEGMPLTLLEGFAAGVPAVATDVGSCRELIYGKDEDDKKIGKAGEVTQPADPDDFAKKTIEILKNPSLISEYSRNAVERVERYYDQKIMLRNYREIYKKMGIN